MKDSGVMQERPYAQTLGKLREAGLRPTRQRLALGRLLFDGGDRHVTAEALHDEAQRAGVSVSLATVYNTLHQFTGAGLLREVVVDSSRTYFDTNIDDHHHFFVEKDGALMDIAGDDVTIGKLPPAPDGMDIARVDVIVRLQDRSDR
ncbi:iron response transcriptional regulator IrrA [Parvibaculum sp.]|uniref:iron response transcriptional regulator IrrA n=1 Tax=Parvibaculum sp. TaxID=2024848 RepID=UPI0025EDFCAF|nr:Fur family transcriptional regulator [Parvibaculum sp.]